MGYRRVDSPGGLSAHGLGKIERSPLRLGLWKGVLETLLFDSFSTSPLELGPDFAFLRLPAWTVRSGIRRKWSGLHSPRSMHVARREVLPQLEASTGT